MIQRIQSLYLLFAGIVLIVWLFLDLPWTSAAADVYAWFTPLVLSLAVLLALGSLGAIFLYGNRARQKSAVVGLQYGALLFMLVLFGVMYLAGDLHFRRDGTTDVEKIIAMASPVAVYVCYYLARRGITRDIALVRSMDRLR